MTLRNSYRTLAAACLAAALLSLAGCGGLLNSRQTIQEEQKARFNDARIGILIQIANQQYEVGDYDKCRESLKKAFEFNYPYSPAHVLAAKVDLEKGQLESAANHLKTAAQIDGNNPETYYLLGVVFQRWQNPQTAHDYYNIAWSKKPNEPLYLLAVVEMKITLGQTEDARKVLEEKLVYFEQTAAIRVALGKLCALKGDYLAAGKYYREASLLSPEDMSIRRNYAESLFFAMRYADAAPILEDMLKNPDLTSINSHDMLFARRLRDEHSGEATQPAETNNEQFRLNLKLMLGQSYLHIHRTRDARTCLAEVTRSDPNNDTAWTALAQATFELEDYAQAVGIAQRVLKTQPDQLQVMILMARGQQKQNQWDEARAMLAHARQVAPQNSTVLCLLGLCAQKLNQPAEARELYRQAAALNPNDLLAQDLLASVTPKPAPVPTAP